MSNYIFSPPPSYGIGEHTFTTWEDGFTDEEIDKIISIGKSLQIDSAKVSDSVTLNKDVRVSKTSWIQLNNETTWLYDRLAYIARCLNGKFYRFDLYGFSEHLQFTLYEGGDNGHYTWHTDSGLSESSDLSPRKLSLVLQLSDPDDYEGGDLEIFSSPDPKVVLKKKGLVAAFPSYTLHRVTPVTKGTRMSLVVWTTGPAFR